MFFRSYNHNDKCWAIWRVDEDAFVLVASKVEEGMSYIKTLPIEEVGTWSDKGITEDWDILTESEMFLQTL